MICLPPVNSGMGKGEDKWRQHHLDSKDSEAEIESLWKVKFNVKEII